MINLTIITVVRNDADGLRITMESVENEIGQAEHLIIDGSDNPLLHNIQRPNVKILHGRDRGISHAFNKGIFSASREFILFLNAGDTLYPGSGEYITSEINNTKADCLWYQVNRVYSRDKINLYAPRLKYLKYAMTAPHQGMIARKSIFTEIGIFPLQKYSMDHYVALNLILNRSIDSIKVIDKVIANYPAGGHSTQGGISPFIFNCLNILRLNPKSLPIGIILNSYLAIKSKLTSL